MKELHTRCELANGFTDMEHKPKIKESNQCSITANQHVRPGMPELAGAAVSKDGMTVLESKLGCTVQGSSTEDCATPPPRPFVRPSSVLLELLETERSDDRWRGVPSRGYAA